MNEENKDKTLQLPPVTFTNHILELSTAAFISLGIIPNPMTGQIDKNLPQAKYLIDTIGILDEKTKGNLTPDEDKQLKEVLFNLRTMYVQASGVKNGS
ncbi:MAG: DUF1844 domain-containing protein [Nitrospirae bacterium]|nr:DUF1844 domain-containing protein [Nitrospirota bacterium]